MKTTTLFLVLALSSLVLSQNIHPREPTMLIPLADEGPIQLEDVFLHQNELTQQEPQEQVKPEEPSQKMKEPGQPQIQPEREQKPQIELASQEPHEELKPKELQEEMMKEPEQQTQKVEVAPEESSLDPFAGKSQDQKNTKQPMTEQSQEKSHRYEHGKDQTRKHKQKEERRKRYENDKKKRSHHQYSQDRTEELLTIDVNFFSPEILFLGLLAIGFLIYGCMKKGKNYKARYARRNMMMQRPQIQQLPIVYPVAYPIPQGEVQRQIQYHEAQLNRLRNINSGYSEERFYANELDEGSWKQ